MLYCHDNNIIMAYGMHQLSISQAVQMVDSDNKMTRLSMFGM